MSFWKSALVIVLASIAGMAWGQTVTNLGGAVGAFYWRDVVGGDDGCGGSPDQAIVGPNIRAGGPYVDRWGAFVWIRNLRAGDQVSVEARGRSFRCMTGTEGGNVGLMMQLVWNYTDNVQDTAEQAALCGAQGTVSPFTLGPLTVVAPSDDAGLVLFLGNTYFTSIYNTHSANYSDITITTPQSATIHLANGAVPVELLTWGTLKGKFF